MTKNIEILLKNNPDLAAYVQGIEATKNQLSQTLSQENQSLDKTIKNLRQENANLHVQIDALQLTLKKFNRQLFGKKSEKRESEEVRNLFNFNEAEAEQNLNAEEPTIEKVTKPRKKRASKATRLQHLETKEIVYDLPEADKSCTHCDTRLVEVGSKKRETIEVIKKALKVLETSITYKCPSCDTFHKQAMPNLPIPGSIASPSLLAQVIVDKTANALPLYRQSEDYQRLNLHLSRQTLSNWMIKASFQLEWIYDKMRETLLKHDIIHADETTVQVLKESGKKASSKSYMWTYVSGKYDNQIVLYDYQTSRGGAHPEAFLKGFNGYLHVDGYSGYQQVTGVTLVHCMAHLRRKFHDIYESLPKEEKENSLTKVALDYCTRIYALDKQSRNLPDDERLAFKIENVKPLMTAFNDWLQKMSLTHSKQSRYGKAIDYAVKHLPSIMNYLEDGRLEIDNNELKEP